MDKKDGRESVEVDPDKIYISDGEPAGGGFFESVFGGLFDVFGGEEEDDFPVDVFDKDFVEVRDVEIIDSEGNAHASHNGKINDGNVGQTKGPFGKFKSKFRK